MSRTHILNFHRAATITFALDCIWILNKLKDFEPTINHKKIYKDDLLRIEGIYNPDYKSSMGDVTLMDPPFHITVSSPKADKAEEYENEVIFRIDPDFRADYYNNDTEELWEHARLLRFTNTPRLLV